jgi:uncharacterized protein (TIGR02246 family)
MAQASFDPSQLQAIFDRYLAAWAARDPDRIAALHTVDTTFRLRLDRPPVSGRAAVRTAFAELFEQWPEFGLELHRLRFGPDHWVMDWAATAVLTNHDGTPRGVRFDCVDFVIVAADGLVSSKDTFVDFAQVQSALAPTAEAP